MVDTPTDTSFMTKSRSTDSSFWANSLPWTFQNVGEVCLVVCTEGENSNAELISYKDTDQCALEFWFWCLNSPRFRRNTSNGDFRNVFLDRIKHASLATHQCSFFLSQRSDLSTILMIDPGHFLFSSYLACYRDSLLPVWHTLSPRIDLYSRRICQFPYPCLGLLVYN
jgi:hypothetical protein